MHFEVESKSYETERIPRLGYEKFEDALIDVNHYIDGYYNTVRPHTHNNSLQPIAGEQQYKMANNSTVIM